MLSLAVQDLSLWQKAGIAFATFGIYLVGQVIYRLFFSPIAHIPGPKIAAASFWYQFYWDVINQGRYLWKIKELHEVYGPIIRINPYEVHINDVEFYDQIYAGAPRRRDKWSFTAKMFGENSGGFGWLQSDYQLIDTKTYHNIRYNWSRSPQDSKSTVAAILLTSFYPQHWTRNH
jgi:hypothetical protein